MSTHTAELIAGALTRERTRAITVCHFTTAHTQRKSRSFHREFLPLAACGIGVRYVAPMQGGVRHDGMNFIALPQSMNRSRFVLGLPSVFATLLRQNANLYHFQDPQLLPLAFALKLIFRKKVVYDAYEDFPSMAASKRSIPRFLRPLAAGIVAAIESLAARCFDGLMTADPFTLRRLARQGKSSKLVFYNFPNLDFFPAPRARREKSFDVVYRGGISERTGIHVLLEALRLLEAQRLIGKRSKPARLLLIGYFDDAAAEDRLRAHIRALGLESNVEIRGRIEHEEMAEALGEARIGVCPLQPVPKFLLNIPVKIFEYWACGLPVVASDLPPIRPFFRNGSGGYLVQPGDPEELARCIAWLLDHPDEAAHMGQHGRELVVQRFNNAGETHKLRKFCARIATDR
ncbi:MAG: glycosyltransferase family 4 protein [Acidobacteriia bacterium]|nr:glycosyltransferase family 4 protein [Terriglobia bacterium]